MALASRAYTVADELALKSKYRMMTLDNLNLQDKFIYWEFKLAGGEGKNIAFYMYSKFSRTVTHFVYH